VGDVFRPGNEKENKVTNHHLAKIYEGAQQGGSNVFLVDATNPDDAVRASASIFAGSYSADTPATVNQSRPVRGSHWMVVYLGAGHSSPVRWVVDSVNVSENKVTMTYHRQKALLATRDIMPYFYWIPLGRLAPGVY